MKDIQDIKKDLADLKAKKANKEQEKDKAEKSLADTEAELADAEKAQGIIQRAARHTQNQVETRFSAVGTAALDAVFDSNPYTFAPTFVERRGKTECDMMLKKDGNYFKPENFVGGGVMDVCSLATRLAMWRYEKTAPVMFMDEPFSRLSVNYMPNVIDMLEQISQRPGLQLIIITNIDEMLATNFNKIMIKKGKQVKETDNDGEAQGQVKKKVKTRRSKNQKM